MKKADLVNYTELIEKKPSKHTTKLQTIVILGIHSGYHHGFREKKGRSYTYFTYKTKEGQYYPASNSTDRTPLILDGLVGTIELSDLKKRYSIIK